MFHMNVPTHLWGNAILTSCFLINKMPKRALNYATPLQTLKNTFPNIHLTSNLPFKFLAVQCSSMCQHFSDPNLIQEPKNVFFQVMLLIKKGISVLILPLGKFMLVWMSTLLKIYIYIFFIIKLLFRGRALMKISFDNKNNQNLVFLFLTYKKKMF